MKIAGAKTTGYNLLPGIQKISAINLMLESLFPAELKVI